MDSELNRQHQLMRFRSAPSSLFADFQDEGCKDFFPRSSSPDPDTMFDRFISSACSPDLESIEDKPLANQRSSQFAEGGTAPHQNSFNSSASQMTFPPPAPLRNLSSRLENSYRLVNSMTVEQVQVKNAGSTGSNLIRHSSSPPGLFANLMDGYGVMRGVANYGSDSNGEAPTSGSRLKSQMNFSAAQNSTPAHLSRISEVANDEEPSLGNGNDNNNSRCYISSFPISSWDDTPLVSENFSGIKRMRSDAKGTMLPGLSSSDTRNGEVGNNPSALSHQFSLPNTSSEMAAVENFLQLHDSVPCKIRAKRGCATHPRSIAERVRRTKISERMRKLQELVPNMDKQTNTADMLDLAVDYIKDLQKEVKKLSDSRASCSCSSKQELSPTPTV